MTLHRFLIFMALVFLLLLTSVSLAAPSRGIVRVIKDRDGNSVGLYRESHALLIGVSDYDPGGWPDLESVPGEIAKVESVLGQQGFTVKKVIDPDADEMEKAFEDFIDAHGFNPDNRLLFFFSGHGYTRRQGQKGYLVPIDAPDPRQDEPGFLRKAIGMGQVLAWARKIEAKHALFAFDSCFSGTVFKTKDLPETPPHISAVTSKAVRQFISAGSAGETVPARSVFTPLFVRALKGEGDTDKDGYVTGTELGMYLQRKILTYDIGQSPQYGKIRDPDLDEGDFVFLASSGAVVDTPSPTGTLLSIESNISGAEVLLGGRRIGTTPLTDYRVKAGSHRLEVLHAGYESYQRTLDFKAGRSQSLYVDLRVVAPATGRLYVDTDPSDARVKIINIGPRYYSGIELEPGSYEVEVSASGYDKKRLTARLRAGEDKYLEVRLERQTSASGGSKIRNSLGMEFVYIEPGTFMMGSPSGEEGRQEDEILHQVTLTKGYYLQTTEVTVGQWRTFVKDTGHPTDAEKGYGYVWTGSEWKKDAEADWTNPGFNQDESHPVTYVSWNDVDQFIKWLNKKGDGQYRFPTEAEWEYAARAGKSTPFHYGDSLSSTQANFDGNYPYGGAAKGPYLERTQSVGSYDSNGWGLYDMHGNVWEWVQDKAGWKGKVVTDTYRNGAVDPVSTSGSYRVFRGGSWSSYARDCRSADRSNYAPGYRSYLLGFRLARIQ